jgi:hypothetical protein
MGLHGLQQDITSGYGDLWKKGWKKYSRDITWKTEAVERKVVLIAFN